MAISRSTCVSGRAGVPHRTVPGRRPSLVTVLPLKHAGLAAENDAGADVGMVADAYLASQHRALADRA